jgi:hypothetical protein
LHFYTTNEIEYLREITPRRTNKEITEMFNKKFNLNLSRKAISGTRKRFGFLTGSDGRFEKGHVPANKGSKGLWKGGEKTQFAKGHKPHNWVPIGSERITKDNYIQVKIQEGKFQKNWKGKHILIWEEHNGPVPPGHGVIFGDGNNRNFNIDNLILVSRHQLLELNRNNLIQKDADLTRTALLITDLNIKMNARKKKAVK